MHHHTGCNVPHSVIFLHQFFRIPNPDLQYFQNDCWQEKTSEHDMRFLEHAVALTCPY